MGVLPAPSVAVVVVVVAMAVTAVVVPMGMLVTASPGGSEIDRSGSYEHAGTGAHTSQCVVHAGRGDEAVPGPRRGPDPARGLKSRYVCIRRIPAGKIQDVSDLHLLASGMRANQLAQ